MDVYLYGEESGIDEFDVDVNNASVNEVATNTSVDAVEEAGHPNNHDTEDAPRHDEPGRVTPTPFLRRSSGTFDESLFISPAVPAEFQDNPAQLASNFTDTCTGTSDMNTNNKSTAHELPPKRDEEQENEELLSTPNDL